MKKTTIETTEVELRGLLSFAYDNPAAKNMHGVFVSEGRLAACSPFALAVRGDPTMPWVAGEGQPVRFTSRLGRWTVFSMPMRSGA